MKVRHLCTSTMMSATLLVASFQAQATSWLDFSQATGLVTISSQNFNNATVLRRVSTECPRRGYLVATAEAGFSLRATAIADTVWIRYSISRNTGIDPNHYRNIQEFVMTNPHSTPAGMLRVDDCKKGETVDYYFLGQRVGNAAANTRAWQPRLAVEFFDSSI